MLLWLGATSALAGTLSVDDAIRKTLLSHPENQVALMRYQSAVSDSKSLQSSLHPRIDATVGYYPTKTFVMPTNSAFSTRQSDAFHADLTGSYTLWDAGRANDRYTASLHKNNEADFNRHVAENALIEQVRLYYYTLAYLDSRKGTAEQSVRFYQAQYERSISMRKNGLKTEADESRFKASLMEAKDALSAIRAETDKTALALTLLIGEQVEGEILKEELDRRCDTIVRVETPETLRQKLAAKNPQLHALQASIDHAKTLCEVAGKERYGNVALVGSYGYDNSLSSYDSSLVGVVGTVPLYEGGKISAEAQKSRISLSLAQKEYESTERILYAELYGAYSDLKRSDEAIAAQQSIIDAAHKTLLLMEGRYAQGLATYIDVLEAQSVVENGHIGLSEAKFQKIRAWAHMEKMLNQGCENDVCKN
ncbi:MAG: TolC family protein [Sulfuricurvum sp.]